MKASRFVLATWLLACSAILAGAQNLAAQDANIAPFGIPSQTSTCFNSLATAAIDGNFGNFTHTCAGNNGAGEAVWELDLDGTPTISQIVVHNRTSCCGTRLRDIVVSLHENPYLEAEVVVGDPIVMVDDGVYEWDESLFQTELLNAENVDATPGSITIDIDPPVEAQYVRIVRIPDPDNSGNGGEGNADEADVLSLGEVEVFGSGGFECPVDGDPEFEDTECESIFVDPPFGEDMGAAGIYTITAVGDDGTGDALLYTFFARSEDGQERVSGPSPLDSTTFDLLTGTWTFSVVLDDDGRCDDNSPNAICESDPVEIDASENLALGKVTAQSSQLGGFTPGLAVDGNPGNFTHTLSGNNGLGPAIWEVDLAEEFEIASIDIFNRTSCCGSRLRDIVVSIHDVSFLVDPESDPIWESELLNPENALGTFPLGPGSLNLVLDDPVLGQFVRITRLADDDLSGSGGAGNQDEATVLSLGEVEVYGTPQDCPKVGDTHCEELTVDPDVAIFDGDPGLYTLTAFADDDDGDEVLYTFRAEEAGGAMLIAGPSAVNFANFTLVEGEWTLSVQVDDDRCPDEADDAICTVEKSIVCQGEADTHCEMLDISGPPGGACGLYEVSAIADDDSGDPVLYTFTADNGIDPVITRGPQLSNATGFDLAPGDWTLSVSVDDDPQCNDVADDAICEREIVVGDCLENVAAGGLAEQSSQLGFFTADIALNGLRTDFTHTLAGNDGLGPAVWEVDLGQERDIARVVLYNRQNCCGSRLRDVVVSIHDISFLDDAPAVGITPEELPVWEDSFWESELLNPENELGTFPTGPGQLVIDVIRAEGEPVTGQFIRVTRLADDDLSGSDGQGNQDEATVLQLAEVEVFECPEGVDCGDPPPPVGDRFVRGDADSSGTINLTDGVNILLWSFQGGTPPACLDAADTDNSGAINLSDPIRIFQWLFLGGAAPVDPEPSGGSYVAEDCGTDTGDDPFDCLSSGPVCGVDA